MVPKFSRRPADWLPAMRQRARGRLGVEAHQLRGRRRRREGAAGRGGVEAGLVVARVDRLGDLALDLDAEMVGEHDVAAVGARRLADGERGRQRRRGRMRQEAVDAVRRDGELGVVIVVGMDADAVGEGGEARRDLEAGCRSRSRDRRRAQGRRGGGARARRSSRPSPDSARPMPVEDRLLAERDDVRGQIAGRRARRRSRRHSAVRLRLRSGDVHAASPPLCTVAPNSGMTDCRLSTIMRFAGSCRAIAVSSREPQA